MRNPLIFLAAVSLAVVLSACADTDGGDPTALLAPEPTVTAISGNGGSGPVFASSLPSPFMCTTSVRTPLGPHPYRYGRFYLHFPQGVARADGATTQFRYVLPTSTGEVFAKATCIVPASEKAIILTARFFRLSPEQVRPAGGKPGDLVITSCTGSASDPCEIDGAMGTAPKLADDGGCDPTIHFGCDETNQGNTWTDPGSTWGEPTGGGDTPEEPTGDPAAFSEGPIAWALCILGFVGSTMTVMEVADKFQSWHTAWQDAVGAYELWQATRENNASPEIQQLYEYQYKQARQRQEDAKAAVHSATNTSYVGLGLAALACGAVALAPTP